MFSLLLVSFIYYIYSHKTPNARLLEFFTQARRNSEYGCQNSSNIFLRLKSVAILTFHCR